jgi:hypothetical protein
LHTLAELTPQQCRDHAAARFPIRRTALAYLDLYSRILDGEILSWRPAASTCGWTGVAWPFGRNAP